MEASMACASTMNACGCNGLVLQQVFVKLRTLVMQAPCLSVGINKSDTSVEICLPKSACLNLLVEFCLSKSTCLGRLWPSARGSGRENLVEGMAQWMPPPPPSPTDPEPRADDLTIVGSSRSTLPDGVGQTRHHPPTWASRPRQAD